MIVIVVLTIVACHMVVFGVVVIVVGGAEFLDIDHVVLYNNYYCINMDDVDHDLCL